ncbi:MAG: ParB N-terminal domain-containing protein [bacterium]
MRKNVSSEEISVNLIVFNSLNLRGLFRSPDQIRRTANSIKEVGLLHHPVVSMTVNGPLVIAGESRVLAYQYLAKKGLKQYNAILCKVLEGISEEMAMKILAEENFCHGTTVPAATANELYWHYRVDFKSIQDHRSVMAKIQGIWEGNFYVYHALIVPGWLINHSPLVQGLMKIVGPKRDGLDRSDVQHTIQSIRRVRLNWWRMMADALSPVDYSELLSAPSQSDLQKFDNLISFSFEMLDDKTLRGERAMELLYQECEPIKRQRLETILHDSKEDENRRVAVEKKLLHFDKIKSKRG